LALRVETRVFAPSGQMMHALRLRLRAARRERFVADLLKGVQMSKASIIGAYNTEFGAFVVKDKATGLMTDTKTYYDLLVEVGRGAIADAGLEPLVVATPGDR
jgi:hypothetical protein